MRKQKKLLSIALAMFLAVAIAIPVVHLSVQQAKAAEPESVSLSALPNDVGAVNGEWVTSKTNADYTVFTGTFDSEKKDENFGLKKFDKFASNLLQLEADSTLQIQNWKWTFGAGNGLIIAVRAKVDCVVNFDFTGVTLSWIDYNCFVNAYKVSAGTQAVTILRNLPHLDTDNNAAARAEAFQSLSVELDVGDTVYYEFGTGTNGGGRNCQGITNGSKFTVTQRGEDPVENKRTELVTQLRDYISKLDKEIYTSADWQAIEGKVTELENGEFSDEAQVETKFNELKAAIDAIKPNDVLISVKEHANKLQTYIGFLTQADYETADWTAIGSAVNALKQGQYNDIAAVETAYEQALAAIKAYTEKSQTLVLGTIPNIANFFGFAKSDFGNRFDIAVYHGTLADKKPFVQSEHTDKELKVTNDAECYVYNWMWAVTKDNAVIFAYHANADIKIDIKWSDNFTPYTNDSILSWYLERDGEQKLLTRTENPSQKENWEKTLYLKEGDIAYMVFEAPTINSDKRNVQSPDVAKATATDEFDEAAYLVQNHEVSAAVKAKIDEYKGLLAAKVEAMNEDAYSADRWEEIEAAVTEFATKCDTELDNTSVEDDVKALYDEAVEKIDAVPTKEEETSQTFGLIDIPETVKERNGEWTDFDNRFDVRVWFGTVEDKIELTADDYGVNRGGQQNYYLERPNEVPGVVLYNWKWEVTTNSGAVVGFRANKDIKLNVAWAEYGGWADNAILSWYIERVDKGVKKISSVNSPVKVADWQKVLYLKEGDIVYLEFIVSPTATAGSTRNIQKITDAKAIATDEFDQEVYEEQNNDLPVAVEAKVAELLEALEAYVATLQEADYSAANWVQIKDYILQYTNKCELELTRTSTVDDVQALYDAALAGIKSVGTKAQEAEALRQQLEGFIAELQAEYDKLIAENKYSTENRAALDKAFEDGKTAIAAATSRALGNNAKNAALSAMRKIEKQANTQKKGCGGFVGGAGIAALCALACAGLVAAKRKR